MRYHFHLWKLVIDTGLNKYYECKICGDRKVVSSHHGYQPIDTEWLNHEQPKQIKIPGKR